MDRCDFYDAELARHHRHLLAAMQVDPADHVLDIGCGAGQTSRDAAYLATEGTVLGVDISAEMIEAASVRAVRAGLRNVAFHCADAQTHPLAPNHFDLCISRFGVMFFTDPVAAFTTIGRAMRPDARLVWMVWQNQERNEWTNALRRALSSEHPRKGDVPPAFSLGDPARATEMLHAAGFGSVDFAAVREPVFYGADVSEAYDALVSLQICGAQVADGDAKRRLRNLLEAHLTPDGVLFDSQAWIIAARRQEPGNKGV
jgi:ubiquinone/menaquinone biosynthesis C-methylase UbiE